MIMKKLCKPLKNRLLALIVLLILFVGWLLTPINNNTDNSIHKYFIAHAGGGIDGYTYTNSKEAILRSIHNKFKYIELDLFALKDSSLLCIHDIREFNQMTGYGDSDSIPTNFKKRRIYNKYTPITLDDVLTIRNVNPFILVTDKIDNPELLNRYFGNDKTNLRVEAFSWQRYKLLEEEGYTPMLGIDKKNIFQYIYYCIRCKERIKWITSSAYSYLDIVKLRILKKIFKVKIAFVPMHNSIEYYKKYIGNEFDLIYID